MRLDNIGSHMFTVNSSCRQLTYRVALRTLLRAVNSGDKVNSLQLFTVNSTLELAILLRTQRGSRAYFHHRVRFAEGRGGEVHIRCSAGLRAG